jgi:hypothetical protein
MTDHDRVQWVREFLTALRHPRVYLAVVQIVRKARAAGHVTHKEQMAWAIEHGYIVNGPPGKAKVYTTSFEEREARRKEAPR